MRVRRLPYPPFGSEANTGLLRRFAKPFRPKPPVQVQFLSLPLMIIDLYKTKGILEYGNNWRLTVNVDQELTNYYRSLIPKWMDVQRPRWPAHITVVREGLEIPVHKEFWNKYNNKTIDFLYEPKVFHGEVYYWLNIYCLELEDIRSELGLSRHSKYTEPPERFRFKYTFHCTIANKK